ncbi:MAG TPA: 3'(2'),5'-bisphosphate nucleotidase CysQ [Alphaproteobacteria bacterium]|nr:3'(2'),5'-bisphosphate nucleotidase CysQ [Alphaproteobacteria bacterium]
MDHFSKAELAGLLPKVMELARKAGAAILTHYRPGIEVRTKSDASPVTAADEEAEDIILAGLRRITPDIPIISEEAFARGEIFSTPPTQFWLVDPLDGTKEFLKRNGEFTVNIALIASGRPILGVVTAPALSLAYAGAGPGSAREWRDGVERSMAVRTPPASGLTVVASRSHGDPEALGRFLNGRAVAKTRTAGSSLKFCLVAAGEADLYPRFGRTMEWDTAAGHAVLNAAGGRVRTLDGDELVYGKPGFENPYFIASAE